jgi:hypothetical protein
MRARAHVVDRAVERDPVEPGGEIRARFEAAQLPIRSHERFLHDVLGVFRHSCHSVRQSVDAAAMTLDEHAKRFLVASPGPGDGSGVVQVHLVH